jgi:hypothetical protein
LLLEWYVSYGHTAPKPPPPIEIKGKKGYELEEILQNEYMVWYLALSHEVQRILSRKK